MRPNPYVPQRLSHRAVIAVAVRCLNSGKCLCMMSYEMQQYSKLIKKTRATERDEYTREEGQAKQGRISGPLQKGRARRASRLSIGSSLAMISVVCDAVRPNF